MCTVSYIPLGKNQFALTSNRDESPSRSVQGLYREKKNDQSLLYPGDIKGGTWICASSDNRLVCLLNGAFARHKHRPPYTKSRGLVVKEYFEAKNAEDFFQNYDLEGIEPFTMVVWDMGKLYQIRRDLSKTYLTQLDTKKSYIWSSSTLYNQVAKIKRQGWFDEWKDKNEYTPASILNLQKTGGEGDKTIDFVMNWKNIVRTVSITQVVNNETSFSMAYRDLINDALTEKNVSLNKLVSNAI
ncbi:MAG: hypothetical protein ACI94Y_000070 [Maribacter sp.]|jgi:uncharacterized protein with NRDE domain